MKKLAQKNILIVTNFLFHIYCFERLVRFPISWFFFLLNLQNKKKKSIFFQITNVQKIAQHKNGGHDQVFFLFKFVVSKD